jgi:hypothetical protein
MSSSRGSSSARISLPAGSLEASARFGCLIHERRIDAQGAGEEEAGFARQGEEARLRVDADHRPAGRRLGDAVLEREHGGLDDLESGASEPGLADGLGERGHGRVPCGDDEHVRRAGATPLVGNRHHRDRRGFDVDLDEVLDQPTRGVGELFVGDVGRSLDELEVVVGGGEGDATGSPAKIVLVDEATQAGAEIGRRLSGEDVPGKDARRSAVGLREGDDRDLVDADGDADASLRAAPRPRHGSQSEHRSFSPVAAPPRGSPGVPLSLPRRASPPAQGPEAGPARWRGARCFSC